MERVVLGRSGVETSAAGLGGGSSTRFGLASGGTRAEALRLIRRAIDLGVAHFDSTGPIGGIDTVLGEGVRGRRDEVVLTTKAHLGPALGPLDRSRLANRVSARLNQELGRACSPATLIARVERSLVELGTDRIDVLFLHAVSPRQYPAAERLAPALERLKADGKIRAVGVSEGFKTDPCHAMLGRALAGAPFVDVVMTGYNLAARSAEQAVFAPARARGVGTVSMFAARGLPRDLETRPEWPAIAAQLRDLGFRSLPALAFNWVHHSGGPDVTLIGTGDPAHLEENVAALALPPPPPELVARIEALLPLRP